MNRPKVLNALNHAALSDLRAAFEDARDDDSVRGVILTGAGDKSFIAGADINEVATDTPVQAEAKTRRGHDLMDLIENLGKPAVAAVNGFALGGGCEAALACTIRLASDSAKFGLPEVKLGIIPGYGGTQRLPRLVGKGVAMQLILSGAMIDATEAHRVGLVNEVLPGPELIGRAEAILNQIGANAPLSVKYAIEAVNKGTETSLAEGLVLESTLVAICTSTEDKKEGTAAFLEKRAANFKGR
jgi:enoyl-CoA hydratase